MGKVELTPEEFEALLDRVAKKAAREALQEVGLHDEHAGKDISDLRGLLSSWRATKKDIGSTIVKTITVAVLMFMAGATAFYVKDQITGQ